MPEEQSKFSGVLAKLKHRPVEEQPLPGQPLPWEVSRYGGEDGRQASAATLTINQQRYCSANTPRKRRPGYSKIPTLRTTSQSLSSSC